ncbi:unnamed protein product [Boreogadus saida]
MEFPLRTMLLLSLGPLLAREIVQGMDIKVYQTADLEVVEGDSSTRHCCWTAVNHTQYRAEWRKNEDTIPHQPPAVTDDGAGCGSALSPVNNGTCVCATLTLPNVTRNHTGRYVCQRLYAVGQGQEVKNSSVTSVIIKCQPLDFL